MNKVSMKQMKRTASFLVAAMMVLTGALAQAEDILYTATVTKDMTIRQTKSTSAKKLGGVEADELIYVIEYGKEWTKIEKDGITGYLLMTYWPLFLTV